jgi:hypothetical protein
MSGSDEEEGKTTVPDDGQGGNRGRRSLMGRDRIPSRVLDAIDAHGGLERWRSVDDLVLSAAVGGASLSVKHQGTAIRHLQAHISPGSQHVALVPYPGPGKRGVFDEGTVRIESERGEVVAERSDPRKAFRGFRHQLWWDKLDVLYFCGYALWTYLTLPFTLAGPGFEVGELEPWEEGGEIWHRIAVRLPSGIHTHCREQVLYFDQKGLVRRHDYTSEVFGSWPRQPTTPPTTRQSTGWSCRCGEGCSFDAEITDR